MRRSSKRLDKVKPRTNTSLDSPHLVVLDEEELWNVDPKSGSQRKVGEGTMIRLASDFELWYDRKALVVQIFEHGVQMCNLTKNDSHPLGCQCAYSCPAHAFEQLDSTSGPLRPRVALDWIHGKYFDDEFSLADSEAISIPSTMR
ncbi:hypothetical protein AAVH_09091 [Aphelenchoides avenae]|nr:hypothetical protein AAVH_09091 [Aphelenchus avenae]